MKRTFKYRLYPTKKQDLELNEILAQHRNLYNAALEQRLTAWHDHRIGVWYYQQAADLTEARAEMDWISCGSASAQQATLRRLDVNYREFVTGSRGRPRFRSQQRFRSVTFPAYGDGIKIVDINAGMARLRVKGLAGHLKFRLHRAVLGKIKTVTLKQERTGKWFLTFSCDNVPADPEAMTGSVVGVDLGVIIKAALSTGEKITNQSFLNDDLLRLAKQQKIVAGRQNGSNRQSKARQQVTITHAKIARKRRDANHKLSRKLVQEHDLIFFEKLAPQAMTSGKSKKLNRSVRDQGWSQLIEFTVYKAQEAGKQIELINPRNTSRECAACGIINKRSRCSRDQFLCVSCNYAADADFNAAQVIKKRGLAGLAKKNVKFHSAGLGSSLKSKLDLEAVAL